MKPIILDQPSLDERLVTVDRIRGLWQAITEMKEREDRLMVQYANQVDYDLLRSIAPLRVFFNLKDDHFSLTVAADIGEHARNVLYQLLYDDYMDTLKEWWHWIPGAEEYYVDIYKDNEDRMIIRPLQAKIVTRHWQDDACTILLSSSDEWVDLKVSIDD